MRDTRLNAPRHREVRRTRCTARSRHDGRMVQPNPPAMEHTMTHQWIRCTSHTDNETIYVNLAHASMIKAHNKGARITLATADEQWFEVAESPAEIIERLDRAPAVGKG
jgi:hypothetical protein